MDLETARLHIRPYRSEDIDQLVPIMTDPVTMSWWPQPLTYAETIARIAMNIERSAADGMARCPIFLREGGQLIGDGGVVKSTIDGEPANDVGYILHHPYWHHGYAIEAMLAVKAYAFDVLGLDALHANMPVDHIASRRVAEKLGMHLVREFNNPRNRNVLTCFYRIER